MRELTDIKIDEVAAGYDWAGLAGAMARAGVRLPKHPDRHTSTSRGTTYLEQNRACEKALPLTRKLRVPSRRQ